MNDLATARPAGRKSIRIASRDKKPKAPGEIDAALMLRAELGMLARRERVRVIARATERRPFDVATDLMMFGYVPGAEAAPGKGVDVMPRGIPKAKEVGTVPGGLFVSFEVDCPPPPSADKYAALMDVLNGLECDPETGISPWVRFLFTAKGKATAVVRHLNKEVLPGLHERGDHLELQVAAAGEKGGYLYARWAPWKGGDGQADVGG